MLRAPENIPAMNKPARPGIEPEKRRETRQKFVSIQQSSILPSSREEMQLSRRELLILRAVETRETDFSGRSRY